MNKLIKQQLKNAVNLVCVKYKNGKTSRIETRKAHIEVLNENCIYISKTEYKKGDKVIESEIISVEPEKVKKTKRGKNS